MLFVINEQTALMKVMKLDVVRTITANVTKVIVTQHNVECQHGFVKCIQSKQKESCMPRSWFCDGENDCVLANGTAYDEVVNCSKC